MPEASRWRERISLAKENKKFSPRDRAEAVLVPRGPAEDLGREFGLRVRVGGPWPDGRDKDGRPQTITWPVYFAGKDGRKPLASAEFAQVLVDSHQLNMMIASPTTTQQQREDFQKRLEGVIQRAEDLVHQMELDVKEWIEAGKPLEDK